MSHITKAIICALACAAVAAAAPNGVVLIKGTTHAGYDNVPTNATIDRYGNLRGPCFENDYCSWRLFIVAANRVGIDIAGKKIYGPTLSYYDAPNFDTHAMFSWGGDIFEVGTTMGIGSFRFLDNGTLKLPRLGTDVDSLIITIEDSSVATPRFTVRYYGWQIQSGKKMTLYYTISLKQALRVVDCELKIIGTLVGKPVTGMIIHPNGTRVQDQAHGLLYTLGRQSNQNGGDSLLLAVRTPPSYFDSYYNSSDQYCMAMNPDVNGIVKWSFVCSWVGEPSPLFRDPQWIARTFDTQTVARPQMLVRSAGVRTTRMVVAMGSRTSWLTRGKFVDIRGRQVVNPLATGALIGR